MKGVTIELRREATGAKCEFCGNPIKDGKEFILDARVSWFRGDDETWIVHEKCYHKKESESRAKARKIAEANQTYLGRRTQRLLNFEEELSMRKIPLVKYNDGSHWFIGGKIDWWPSTGTLVFRDTKKQRYVPEKRAIDILSLLG